MEGWLVVPDIESTAQSMISAPAAAAASCVATPVPAVSWVWTWMGTPGWAARRAPTSRVAARGLSRPAMSLMAKACTPCATSASASAR